MSDKDLIKLLEIVKNDPDSKKAKAAQAEMNYLFTRMTIKQNRIITFFTIVVGLATLLQVVMLILEMFVN